MTTNPELKNFQELLGRFMAIPEQAEETVTTEDLQKFNKLVDVFGKIPEAKGSSRKTFFEVCGIPSREVCYSSFLAFFLDPNGEHGFGDLFLRSLVEASGKKLDTKDFISVETEVPTDKGRIDLVIEGDSFVIGIENKIGAGLYNDLQDYFQHLDNLASQANPRKQVLALVLSLNEEKGRDGFVPVSYQRLIDEIQKYLGQTLPQADSRSITYLLDFINSIHHLEKGTRMDKTLLQFFQDNEEPVIKLYQKTRDLAEMLRDRIKTVYNNVQFPPQFGKPLLWGSIKNYDPEENAIYDVIACDVALSEALNCRVETGLSLKRWRIYVWMLNGKRTEKALVDWFQKNNIQLKESEWGLEYAAFPFEDSEEVVAEKYNELLVKIADKLDKTKTP